MSHQDHEQKFEQQLNTAMQDIANETTSESLDQSILAMAEKHHAKVEKLGFWSRVFRSRQMKYLVSMSAALVMTVGIARFMVYLGKTDQGLAQSSDIRMAQTVTVEHDDFAFEMADEVAAAPVSRQNLRKEKAEPIAVPELITNDEMRQILSESERLAKKEAKSSEALEDNKVVVTGSRLRSAEAEADYAAGVLDEAIEGAPTPEVWLEEIQVLLEQKQIVQAAEEWTQLKNTYPEFQIEAELAAKFKEMGLTTRLID